MDEYWNAITESHREKIRLLAEKSGIPVDRAFTNLMKQLERDMADQLSHGKFEEMVTIRQIERMLDGIDL